MRNWLYKFVILVLAVGLETHCGPGTSGNSQNVACTPNVIDSGLQLFVAPLNPGSNIYAFTLCSQAQTQSGVYSVYGGMDTPSVTDGTMSLSGAKRVTHISTATSPGTSFQVTFKSTDLYFSIYEDSFDGSQYRMNSQTALVSAHPLPGRN